jgi:hypothetical protein
MECRRNVIYDAFVRFVDVLMIEAIVKFGWDNSVEVTLKSHV